jgi:integrase
MATKRARRAAGEGSISQRPDGMWIGTVDAPSTDGKRRQKKVYSRDYRECVRKLNELKKELAAGVTVTRTMTVSVWLDRWLTEIHKDEIRPSTRRSYEVVIRQINSAIGTKRIASLTPEDVRGMIRELGNGRRRTQKSYVLLNAALKDAVREGILVRNVCDAVHKPRLSATPREAFTLGEARTILGYAAEHRDAMEAARWAVAFFTGIRQGEALGLSWDRIDLDGAVADVEWQLQALTRDHGCGAAGADGAWPCGKVKGAYCTTPRWDTPPDFEMRELYRSLVLTRPKTHAGRRFIPLVPPMVAALRKLRELDCGENPHNLIFHLPDGRPVPPKTDWEAWQKLMRDAGICEEDETIPPHVARHTTATIMRAAGVDEQTRMELLGHSSATAQRIYAHASLSRQREAMASLSALSDATDDG